MGLPSPACPKSYTVNVRLARTEMISPTFSPRAGLHHNRDLALQKYFILQEQHEVLRQHLDELRPLDATMFYNGSIAPNSPSTSPPVTAFMPFVSGTREPNRGRSSSLSQEIHGRPSFPDEPEPDCYFNPVGVDTDLDDTSASWIAAEEAKLFDVNEGIKRTLTELLNCEAVRSDRMLRTWVQHRLLDAEKELRSGRRRRSGQRSREGSDQWISGRPLLV